MIRLSSIPWSEGPYLIELIPELLFMPSSIHACQQEPNPSGDPISLNETFFTEC